MSLTPLYEFEEKFREYIIRTYLEKNFGAEKVIKKPGGGFGDVYRIEHAKNVSPRFLAAKCPKITYFDSKEKAVEALDDMLREAEKTYSLFQCPWVNPVTKILLIHGWPFLISRWRDVTLSDLISYPNSWCLVDRLACLLQIVRVLRMAAKFGISAHQDLKPENIFVDYLPSKFLGLRGTPGLRFRIFVADFGIADAFRESENICGTLPYMAPELFEDINHAPTAGAAVDIFAVGVIAHMCFCDGLHPTCEVNSGVWKQKSGSSGKCNEECMWQNWAKQEDKGLSLLKESCPAVLFPVISSSLDADSEKRPSPEEFEAALWKVLEDTDAYEAIQVLVKEMESMYAGNQWPHFEERLASLRGISRSMLKSGGDAASILIYPVTS